MTESTETTDKILCIYTRNDCNDLTKITGIVATAEVYSKSINKLRTLIPNLATALFSSSYKEAKNLTNGVYSNDVAIVCPKEIGLKYGLKCLKELN